MNKKEIEKIAIEELEGFLGRKISSYSKKSDNIITKKQVKEISDYLEKEYNFSEKIYKNKEPKFLIVDIESEQYNSLCFSDFNISDEGRTFKFYLFNCKDNLSPIAILFHEFGHAIHLAYTGGMTSIPKPFLEIIKIFGFERIEELEEEQQCEVFADILSMGLMLDSPFEKYDIFTPIHRKHKEAYKELVKQIFKLLP
ncbi:MAG: hypothetical protein RR523_14835 [Cetobacterium sp.]|uniref:hypothetical protein n=1 Tax=Cetobacterium sp. TaxID=2071632 RepID=UPI002FCA8C67